MKNEPFKICTNCSDSWDTLEQFLDAADLELVGYQVAFEDLEGGLFYFTHTKETCLSTLAIPVKKFIKLSPRAFLEKHGDEAPGCAHHCVREGDLEPCPLECECSWVREIIQLIKERKKSRT